MTSIGSALNSITPNTASSAILWSKARQSLYISVSAPLEAQMLQVPPVYQMAFEVTDFGYGFFLLDEVNDTIDVA